MSSHHIVRDAQEPALVIASTSIPFETIGQLLEWSPVVVVLENCLEEVLAWDIKIDKIICPSAHYLSVLEMTVHQQPLQILPSESEQMVDFLHFAIQNLLKNGHDAISIVGDDFAPKDFEKYAKEVELIVYHDDSKGYFIKEGIFKKWVTAKTIFYFPDKEGISKFTSLTEISPFTFQAMQTGLVSFEVNKTVFVKES